MEKVSVIIPVYNSSKFIKRCIKSIINQTYKNLEIICINDGSTDDSYDILKKLKKEEKRIKLIDKKNGGVSSARNAGLSRATGEYIMFVDIDDYLMPNMINKLVQKIQTDISDLVICNYKIKINEKIKKQNINKKNEVMTKKKFLKEMPELYRKALVNQPWNKLYIKSKITKNFDENINLGEDLIFNINYIKNVEKISFLNECEYIYDISNENSLTKIYKNTSESFFYIHYYLYNELYYSEKLSTSVRMDVYLLKNYVCELKEIYKIKQPQINIINFLKEKYKFLNDFRQDLTYLSIWDRIKKRIVFSKLGIYVMYIYYMIKNKRY